MSTASANVPADRRALEAALAAAPDLFELGVAARRAGLGPLLTRAFASFLPEPSLSKAASAALRPIREEGAIFSLDELLEAAAPEDGIFAPPPAVDAELRSRLVAMLVQYAPEQTLAPAWDAPDELLDWAESLGLEDLFEERVTSLPDLVRDREVARRLKGHTFIGASVLDVAARRNASRVKLEPLLGRTAYAKLVEATRSLVREQADLAIEAAREAAADDAAWETPPADPALGPAFRRLKELRRPWPEAARLPVRALSSLELRWEPGPAALVALVRCGKRQAWEPHHTFRVLLPADPPHAAQCSCGDARRCPHQLVALAAARRHLGERAHAGTAAFRDHLATPAWARLLAALDRAASRASGIPDEAAERIAWRVSGLASAARGLHVTPYRQKRRVSGGWSSGACLDAWTVRSAAIADDRDRSAASLLVTGETSRWDLFGQDQPALRALLALRGHPALFLDSPELPPLVVREGRFALEARTRPDGGVRLVATAAGGEVPFADLKARVDRQEPARLLARFDPAERTITITRIPAAADGLLRALADADPAFPPEAVPELAACAERFAAILPVELPEAALGEEVPATDGLVLRLTPGDGVELDAEVLARPLAEGAAFPPGEGSARVHARIDDRSVFARRSFDRERERALALVASLPLPAGAEEAEGPRFQFRLEGEAALDLVAHLSSRPAEPDFAIEWTRPPRRVTRAAVGADLRVRVSAQRDWFAVDGEVRVDGVELALAVALDAARRGARYVEATPEVFVALSAELRRRLVRAADAVHAGRHGLEVSLPGATAVEELLEGAGELEVAASFRGLLERIRKARDVTPVVPAAFAEILRPYQADGFRWLARLAEWGAGGCLADDMGLGKTLQALALLSYRRDAGPALVVAPTSVCGNWLREAERFAAPLRLANYGAIPEARRAAAIVDLGPGDVLVTSYTLVARDIGRLAGKRFATLVLDEAQAVKNAETARTQAVRALEAEVRFALSGTPLENHLGELWSLYRILVPGLLGSFDAFRERFGLAIERDRDPARREALARLLRPFLLRRTKAEVAPELPPRTEADVEVELSAAERRLYREARLATLARVKGLAGNLTPEQRRFEMLAGITRLRLCACHPRLYDKASKVASSKLARLVELLVELKEEGHRALVFSQFVSHLDLAEAALRAAGLAALRLDGSTPAAKRLALVDAFQAGRADVFLISLKAGGTGLNLTAADYVIHLDPWWNPAVEDQATDRAHRIGQTRPVTVLRLISQGTIEEAILDLHASKRELVAGVLEGADAAARVGADELLELLEAGDDTGAAGDEAAPPPRRDGRPLPACLGAADGDLDGLLARYRDHLLSLKARRLVGDGPVKAYARSMARFVAWLGAGGADGLAADASLAEVRGAYLAALRSRAIPAPPSEPQIAGAALNKLAGLLEGE